MISNESRIASSRTLRFRKQGCTHTLTKYDKEEGPSSFEKDLSFICVTLVTHSRAHREVQRHEPVKVRKRSTHMQHSEG